MLSTKSSEFLRWAEEKEKNIPQNINEILVDIHDINNVKVTEISKIKETIRTYNSCIYQSNKTLESNSNLLKFSRSLGMQHTIVRIYIKTRSVLLRLLKRKMLVTFLIPIKRLIGILMVIMIINQYFLGFFIVSTLQVKEVRIIYLIMNLFLESTC